MRSIKFWLWIVPILVPLDLAKDLWIWFLCRMLGHKWEEREVWDEFGKGRMQVLCVRCHIYEGEE